MFAPVAHAFSRDLPAQHLLGWSQGKPVTWGELRARVAAMSRRLDERGATGGVLACSRPFLFLAAMLALSPQSVRPSKKLRSQSDSRLCPIAKRRWTCSSN